MKVEIKLEFDFPEYIKNSELFLVSVQQSIKESNYIKEEYVKNVKATYLDLESLLETHYEIVAWFYNDQENEKLLEIENTKGRGGMWMFAKELAEEFETVYSETIWGENLDWHDTLDEFLKEKLK